MSESTLDLHPLYAAPTTDREARIQQVAGLIGDGAMDEEMARLQNLNGGWSFEVRWPSHEYINDTDFTRVEGAVLSEADLLAALELAETWRRDLERS